MSRLDPTERHLPKSFVILCAATVLYTLFRYEGHATFFLTYLNRSSVYMAAQARSQYYQRAAAFLLLGVVPILIIKLGFRERLRNYAIFIPKPFLTALVSLLGIAVVTPFAYFGSRRSEITALYPAVLNAGDSFYLFLLSASTYFLYYIGYEICFRGFLFMGLANELGEWQALGVSLLATVLLHVTQPQSETLMSIVAGVIFPLITWRLNSVWPGIFIHSYFGISLDYWIVLGKGGM